jgi:hypothetical protein
MGRGLYEQLGFREEVRGGAGYSRPARPARKVAVCAGQLDARHSARIDPRF